MRKLIKINLKSLSLFITLFLFLGLCIYFLFNSPFNISSFFDREDPRNTPVSNLSELAWEKGPFKIYYQTNENLYSIRTDGTKKTLIFPKIVRYLLLDSTRNILISHAKGLSLIDEKTGTEKPIFQLPGNRSILNWRLSPDEAQIVLQLLDKDKWKNSKKDIVDDIYIVHLKTGKSRQLDITNELENYTFLNNIFWSLDGTKVYLDTTKYITGNDGRALYFVYDLNSDTVDKIGEENYSLDFPQMKGLKSFITTSPAIETRRDNVTRIYYYSRISPDGSKMVDVDNNGNIKINNQNIIFWLYNGMKGPKYCYYPGWLADNNHVIIECLGLRIIETNTKKVTVLEPHGRDAQWFNQKFEELYSN